VITTKIRRPRGWQEKHESGLPVIDSLAGFVGVDEQAVGIVDPGAKMLMGRIYRI